MTGTVLSIAALTLLARELVAVVWRRAVRAADEATGLAAGGVTVGEWNARLAVMRARKIRRA